MNGFETLPIREERFAPHLPGQYGQLKARPFIMEIDQLPVFHCNSKMFS
jgi:hypothetical protein